MYVQLSTDISIIKLGHELNYILINMMNLSSYKYMQYTKDIEKFRLYFVQMSIRLAWAGATSQAKRISAANKFLNLLCWFFLI